MRELIRELPRLAVEMWKRLVGDLIVLPAAKPMVPRLLLGTAVTVFHTLTKHLDYVRVGEIQGKLKLVLLWVAA